MKTKKGVRLSMSEDEYKQPRLPAKKQHKLMGEVLRELAELHRSVVRQAKQCLMTEFERIRQLEAEIKPIIADLEKLQRRKIPHYG